MGSSPPPWARIGSEPVGTGTPVIGVSLEVKLEQFPPEDSPAVAEVMLNVVGKDYGPVKVTIPLDMDSAPIPVDMIKGLDHPDGTEVRARLLSITPPFKVDEERNIAGATLGTLLHHIQ